MHKITKNPPNCYGKACFGGNENKIVMAKVRQISEIAPSFAFTEYDFYKDYEESFKKSELGRIHSILPLREMAVRFGLRDSHPHKKAGRKSYFSPEGKVALMFLKAYTGLSAPKLMEQLNANIHYQLFSGIRICSNRIVSVNKPYVRPIMRGKEIKKVEFGAKIYPRQLISSSLN